MSFKISVWVFVFGLLFCYPAWASQDFSAWLEGVRQEALSNDISSQTVNEALSGLHPIPRIIELDRKQPEGKMSFAQYRKNIVTQDRIEKGRRLYGQHRALLEETGAKYGVQPQYIVALWGIETSYGNNTGGYDVIAALATLAHDGRRSAFFRKELMNALKILDEGHITHAKMKGSWAGAMGQNQFMPSSFKGLAVDGNGDGKRDIWTSLPDVFASTANYLSKNGWKDGERWGRAVTLPAGFSSGLTGLEVKKPLLDWIRLGVRLPSGEAIPVEPGMEGSIVTPDGAGGPAFLVYDNYRTIMRWNKSTYFATSVGLLADGITQ